VNEQNEVASPDPSALSLFAATPPEPRPGRVRSQFSMRPNTDGHDPIPGPRQIWGDPVVVNGYGPPAARRRSADEHQGIDWALVAAFRAQASDQLSAAIGEDRGRLDRAGQEQLGRSIILELLQSEASENLSAGRDSWSLAEQDVLAEAIFDSLFGLGRLQPLVDDEAIENIEITGCDQVLLEYSDGTLKPGPSVAETDEELIDFLGFLASRSEVNARPFSQAQPSTPSSNEKSWIGTPGWGFTMTLSVAAFDVRCSLSRIVNVVDAGP